MRLTRDRALLILGAIAYVMVFQWNYVFDLHTRWGYLGLEHHGVGILMRMFYSTVAVLPALWMPVRLRRPSEVGYWFVYLLAFVPSVLVPPEAIGGPDGVWMTLSIVLLLCMGILRFFYSLKTEPLGSGSGMASPAQFWVGFAFVAATLYLVVATSFGLQINLPSLAEVYDVRADYKDMVRRSGVAGAYAVAWTGNVVNPFLVLWGIARKRRLLLIAGVVGQLVLFSVTALKLLFFSIFMIALLLLALRRKGRGFGLWMIFGALAIQVAGIVELRMLQTDLITGVFVRRLMVTPGHLTGLYIDYFSSHEKALLGHSILSSFVHYPYDGAPPKLIATEYFVRVAHANASIWADGFANFGYPGVVGATVLLGGLFWTFDRAALGLDKSIAATMFGLPAFTLSNSGILTCILTHGIAVVTVLVFLLPRERGPPSRT